MKKITKELMECIFCSINGDYKFKFCCGYGGSKEVPLRAIKILKKYNNKLRKKINDYFK